ncbi:hypothetical protein K3495_g12267 [Podosphaera aphanis]|nr:hypothetical protein K3495_g12267 [Podosphaera aphanis]
MFRTFKALTERSEALISTRAELESAHRRTQELERAPSSSAGENADPIERLVQALNAQTRSHTIRSAELRETEIFSGLKKDFPSWKESVLLKLNVNADHYPTDQSKMALIYSLLNPESRTHIRPWLSEGVLTYPSLADMWTHLTTLFDDPNASRDAAARLHSNYQKKRPFSSWIADIRRDALLAGYDTNSLQLRNLVLLNMSVELKRALIHERDIDSLNFDQAVSRLQDIDNRQRSLAEFLSRGNRRDLPGPSVQSSNPPVNSAANAVHGDPMDLSGAVAQPRGPLSQEERDRRRRNGLCYYCGEPGHKSGGCPRKNRSPAVVGRSAEFAEIESVESGNADAL